MSPPGRLLDPTTRAVAVVDWGFGDAGKGLATDYLTGVLGATAVVRFNGGAQAGHNVVTPDGRHHCFSQWGSGSFRPGVESWLGPGVVLHPGALAVEAAHLGAVGIRDAFARLRVHEGCPVVTPQHQALGRLRELARGAERHGSCGVGVGEVMAQLEETGLGIRAGHLRRGAELGPLLARVQGELRDRLEVLRPRLPASPAVDAELSHFTPDAGARWQALATKVGAGLHVVDEERWRTELAAHRRVVFEGAQGTLLDRDHGLFPHTSRGTCTFAPALELAAASGHAEGLFRLAVLRTHLVRHGQGPLPSEISPAPPWATEAHNATGPWQGPVRHGWPDLVLLRHARRATEGADGLLVTHLDRVGADWAWVRRYEDRSELPRLAELDLSERAAISRTLCAARPIVEPLRLGPSRPGRAMAEQLADALDTPLTGVASGPRAADVEGVR